MCLESGLYRPIDTWKASSLSTFNHREITADAVISLNQFPAWCRALNHRGALSRVTHTGPPRVGSQCTFTFHLGHLAFIQTLSSKETYNSVWVWLKYTQSWSQTSALHGMGCSEYWCWWCIWRLNVNDSYTFIYFRTSIFTPLLLGIVCLQL